MTAPETRLIFPETTLAAGNLILRPFTPADADDVTEACQDSETLRWLPLPRPYTRANAEWFIGTFGPGQRQSGVGIVFVQPDTSGYILICFSGTQFMVGQGQTQTIAGGDFELTRRQYVELVQRLLPDDAELKTLKLTTDCPPCH